MRSRGLEQTAALDPTLHICRTPDCTYIACWAGPEDGPPSLDCPLCKVARCLVCGASPFHTGQSCPPPPAAAAAAGGASGEGGKGAASLAAEEQATREYFAANEIKPCPRCATPLVKSHGCDKMKCRCAARDGPRALCLQLQLQLWL